MTDRSLNSGRTRKLSEHSRTKLAEIANAPAARGKINPGVVDRLTRGPEPLCVIVMRPSPFKKDRGREVEHLMITTAGVLELRREGGR